MAFVRTGLLNRGSKSFRVIGTKALDRRRSPSSAGNFSYTHFDHARNMWETEIWANNVVERAKAQLMANGSSPQDAKEMTTIINLVANILNKSISGKTKLTRDEANMVRQLGLVRWINKDAGEDHLAMSLLDYVSYGGDNHGISFENRFNELMRSLFTGGENMSFSEGKTLNTIRADEMVSVGDQLGQNVFSQIVELINTDSAIRKNKLGEENGAFSLSGKDYQKLRTTIRKTILDAANLDLNKLFNGEGIEILFKKEDGDISQIIVTKVRKEQKIDINVNSTSNLEIKRNLHPRLQRLAKLVKGKTFTLKNYLETTYKKGGFSLGDTSDGRMLSALFAYATGNTTYCDVATFIWATKKSEEEREDSTLARYRSWGATIYELLGIGTRGDGRIPDYFVGNIYTKDQLGTGHVVIRSTLDYLNGAPSGTNLLISKQGRSIRI